MRVIIAGSRDFSNYEFLEQCIKESGFNITGVISGGANGVDKLGEIWCIKNLGREKLKIFPAKWDDLSVEKCVVKINKFGKEYNILAGSNRNQEMAEDAEGLICIVKNRSKGSLDMIKKMKNMGKYVYEKHILNKKRR